MIKNVIKTVILIHVEPECFTALYHDKTYTDQIDIDFHFQGQRS